MLTAEVRRPARKKDTEERSQTTSIRDRQATKSTEERVYRLQHISLKL